MKAMVVNNFRDKNTRKVLRAGQIIEVTKERFDEIAALGVYIEKVAKPKAGD